MKKLILFTFFIIFSLELFAQKTNNADLYNFGLKQSDVYQIPKNLENKIFGALLIDKISKKTVLHNNGSISDKDYKLVSMMYFEKYPEKSDVLKLEALGCKVYQDSWIPPLEKHPYGFMIVSVPLNNFIEIISLDCVKKIDDGEREIQPLNNQAARKVKADSLWISSLTGTGIKVGILDSGFDLMPSNAEFPSTYDVRDYSDYPNSIDNNVENTVTGHGTHVAGSVLGRGTLSPSTNTGNGGGSYKGMAYNGNAAFLKIGSDATSNSSTSAEVIAMKAAVDTFNCNALTMSYGGWGSYNDGSEPAEQTVDWVYSRGKAFFVSAGNSAANSDHYSATVNANDSSAFIRVNVAGSGYYFSYNMIWADGSARNNLTMKIYNNSYVELTTITKQGPYESERGTEELYCSSSSSLNSGTYYIKVFNPSTSSQMFHIFDYSGASAISFNNPVQEYTIGSPALADHACAVAAWVSRSSWMASNGGNYTYNYTADGIAPFSSKGPRIDGIQKPDIAAPGSVVISVRDRDVYTSADYSWIDDDGTSGGAADYYVMQGTSMACPVAAGAAALVLQKFPTATPDQLYKALKNKCDVDSYTGTVPNSTWGYGKLNVNRAVSDTSLPMFITITNAPSSICKGVQFNVQFTTNKTAYSGNVYTAQLSDASGSFTSPTVIGTLSSQNAGSISCSLPSSVTTSGTNYQIRVVPSNPVSLLGTNSSNITINNISIPDITGQTTVCTNQTSVYSVPADATCSFNWTVDASKGTISGSSTSNSVNIIWNNPGTAAIKLVKTNTATLCKDSVQLTATVYEADFSGNTDVNPNTTETYTATNAAGFTSHLWTVTGGTIQGSNTSTSCSVLWGSVGTGSLRLIETNSGNAKDTAVKTVNIRIHYCQASATCAEYINNVSFGSISNSSGAAVNGYGDFTSQSASIGKGNTYKINITTANGVSADQCKAWIDWNQDGDFSDAAEALTLVGTPGVGPYYAYIVVPDDATLGSTRLRIRLARNVTPSECGYQDNGEVEDYTVNVISVPKINVTALLYGNWNGTTHNPSAIMLELRSGATLSSSILTYRTTGILSDTGSINLPLTGVSAGSYWLVLRANGYLPIVSASRITYDGNTSLRYDFSRDTNQVYSKAMIKVNSGRCMMNTGDMNSDRRVTSADINSSYIANNSLDLRNYIPDFGTYTKPSGNLNINLAITALLQGMWDGTSHIKTPVVVELRTGTDFKNSVLYDRESAYIDSDGTINVNFNNIITGSYWLGIRANCQITVGSSGTISIQNNGNYSYDFSRNLNQIYNAQMVTLSNSRYLIKSGDINNDKRINASDLNIYIIPFNSLDFRSIVPVP